MKKCLFEKCMKTTLEQAPVLGRFRNSNVGYRNHTRMAECEKLRSIGLFHAGTAFAIQNSKFHAAADVRSVSY